jgi:hypothetical protein
MDEQENIRRQLIEQSRSLRKRRFKAVLISGLV